jgi:hypothetical protein
MPLFSYVWVSPFLEFSPSRNWLRKLSTILNTPIRPILDHRIQHHQLILNQLIQLHRPIPSTRQHQLTLSQPILSQPILSQLIPLPLHQHILDHPIPHHQPILSQLIQLPHHQLIQLPMARSTTTATLARHQSARIMAPKLFVLKTLNTQRKKSKWVKFLLWFNQLFNYFCLIHF